MESLGDKIPPELGQKNKADK